MKYRWIWIFMFGWITGLQGQKINLGKSINHAKRADLDPVMSSDGQTLYFSRANCETIFACETDIYVSYKQKNGTWSIAQAIPELNNADANAIVYIYPDGNKIILKDTYTGKSGFAWSQKLDNQWSPPIHIAFKQEPTQWKNHNCKLSADGMQMIFSNTSDLYLSHWITEDSLWDTPILITDLSTSDAEFTPYLAADNRTLYFSSGGWGGEGQNDIVKSIRKDDTWLHWTKPEPLGKPINSAEWESFFITDNQGDTAIVFSRENGNGDLYKVALTGAQKPSPVVILQGKVVEDRYKKPIQAYVQVVNETDQLIHSYAFSDPNTGLFSLTLAYGKQYNISAQTKDYTSISQPISLPDSTLYTELPIQIELIPLEIGRKITLQSIFTEPNSYYLSKKAFILLDRMAEMLQVNPQIKIQIWGHADSTENLIESQKLSIERAFTVQTYWVDKGISISRLKIIGFGKTKPISENTTEEGKKLNKRIELVIY